MLSECLCIYFEIEIHVMCLFNFRFMVNRKIFIVGFGLYGSIQSPAEYIVNIQVGKRTIVILGCTVNKA